MREIEGDYIQADNDWDEILWIWERTEAPKGCKVEIIDGIVMVTPLSRVAHHVVAGSVQRRLHEVIPARWSLHQRLPLTVPARLGLYVPDLAVLPEREPNADLVPVSEALLVAEVTSKATAHRDRTSKPAGYAAAGAPLYLLVDRWAPGGPTVTLYGEPRGGVYRTLHAGKFGDPVELPGPFGLTLDTGDFPVD